MTIDEVLRLYPDRSLALLRVERGSRDERRFVWMAQWNAGYFTSDTDRHVFHEDHHHAPAYGDTPEAALGALVQAELDAADRLVAYHEEALQKAVAARDACPGRGAT